VKGTFADFEADVVPVDGVDGGWRECHGEGRWRRGNWIEAEWDE
jgi:hypothetical protein